MLKSLVAAVRSAAAAASYGSSVEVQLNRAPEGRGDLTVPLSALAKSAGQSPMDLAQKMALELAECELVESSDPVGPFLNVSLEKNALFEGAIRGIEEKDIATGQPQRILVEYLSPNTNKPLHLGHVRNGVLGSTLAKLLSAVGHDVVRANLINDRGEHICKSMLAYQLFGNGATPESVGKKGDHFVGDMYVRYAQEEKLDPSLDTRKHEMLRLWEAGDPATLELWQLMNGWVLSGFEVTNDRYGFRFDKVYRESEGLYKLGKDKVDEGLERGIFLLDEKGAVRYQLDPKIYGLGIDKRPFRPKVRNEDGTSLYLTQDIGTAIMKVQEFDLDRSIYVVASEQNYHFMSLFSILREFGYPWAQRCYHMSYGMVTLPDGAKMKSREGTVVDADDLADEMAEAVAKLIREREPELEDEEVRRRAEVVGMAAIKFFLVKYPATSSISFDRKNSLAFDGDTGPYCLYTYARAMSILERMPAPEQSADFTFEALGNADERGLALELLFFPDGIVRAAQQYAPAIVAERLLNLCKAFNRFYKNNPVHGAEPKLQSERLLLVKATAEAIRWGLSFLSIEPLEKM